MKAPGAALWLASAFATAGCTTDPPVAPVADAGVMIADAPVTTDAIELPWTATCSLGRSETPVEQLAFSTDGRWLAALQSDGLVTVLELAGTGARQLLVTRGRPARIALTEDGGILAAGSDGDVVLWNVQEKTVARRLEVGIGPVVSLKFSDAPEPYLLASVERVANPTRNLKIWRIADGVLVGLITGSPHATFTHADAAVLLLDESDGRYDVVSFQGTPKAGAGFPRPLTHTAFAADGAFMAGMAAAGPGDQRLATLSVQDSTFVWQASEPTRDTRQLVFLENPSRIVQLANRSLLYDHDNGQILRELPALNGTRAAAATPDGSALAAVGPPGQILLVSMTDGSSRILNCSGR